MQVTRLGLVDFRSYPGVEVALPAGVSVLTGPNGAGKTNLLEALGYLSALASHRVSSDAALVRLGAERAVLRAGVARSAAAWQPAVPDTSAQPAARVAQTLVELEICPGRANRARVNRAPVPRAREILGLVRTVLFAPEDLSLVRGDPDGRRRLLDDLLCQRSPRFAGVRADYDRVVRQRTALLRAARAAGARTAPASLDSWDEQLVRFGAQLWAGRLALVTALAPHVTSAVQALAPAGRPASIAYASRADVVAGAAGPEPGGAGPEPGGAAGGAEPVPAPADPVAELAQRLRAHLVLRRRAELERGVTLVGPHRDDLDLLLDGLPAKGYASHGESWSLALGLRLAAYELLRSEGEEPVLLLDDVFAELDDQRRSALARLVSRAEQVIVTAAVDADVPRCLGGVRFRVHDGQVLPDG